MATIRARYDGGILTPLEPLDLTEGAEVTVSVEAPVGEDAHPGSKDGPLAGVLTLVREMEKTIPPKAWDVLPADLAKNKKHYLYGHPKEEE